MKYLVKDKELLVYQPLHLPVFPSTFLEAFISLVFHYGVLQPPDKLTRELAYRMLRQKIGLVCTIEDLTGSGVIYIVGITVKGTIVLFEITPPKQEVEGAKFKGWRYRTIRDPRAIPTEVLRVTVEVLEHALLSSN